jgi:YcaO-like protein with predicted kinase domain
MTLPLKLGSERDLRLTHRLVDVQGLPRTTTSTFHADLPLLWIEGTDLGSAEPIWVPYEVVHTNYTFPQVTGSGCFAMTSNGLASGNHLLEAISHGICEVVERDATTLWTLGGAARQAEMRLDLTTIDDPGCCWVLERFAQARIEVAVWETTTDVGIPAFLCVIAERDADPLRSLYTGAGMGCHPTRGVALLRALTEAAQSRATLIAGSRDDCYRVGYEEGRHPDVLRAQRAQLAAAGALRNFRAVPSWESDSLAEDIAWELERLSAVGCEQVIMVDLTRPEFRLSVARMIIPGLEGPEEKLPDYVPGARARAVMEGAR